MAFRRVQNWMGSIEETLSYHASTDLDLKAFFVAPDKFHRLSLELGAQCGRTDVLLGCCRLRDGTLVVRHDDLKRGHGSLGDLDGLYALGGGFPGE